MFPVPSCLRIQPEWTKWHQHGHQNGAQRLRNAPQKLRNVPPKALGALLAALGGRWGASGRSWVALWAFWLPNYQNDSKMDTKMKPTWSKHR